MVDKNVQLKDEQFNKLYPKTLAKNVVDEQTNLSVYDTLRGFKNVFVDIKSFGAKGDGVTNDSLAIKAFLASGGNLLVSHGTYMMSADVYSVISNTRLVFEGQSKFKLLPHAKDSYSMLQLKDVDNVTIDNAWLDGSKSQNTVVGQTGEWGHGIDVLNSSKITITNPVIENTWGDGIYVGHNFYGVTSKVTDTVKILFPTVDGSRRNGISICGGKNILVDSPVIKNVRGTFPMCAVDIEPEGDSGVLPLLENVTVRNVRAFNCGSGVLLILENLKDRDLTTDITVDGLKTIECDTTISIGNLTGILSGSVSFKNIHSIRGKSGVIFMSGYGAFGTPRIIIDGIDVDKFNTLKSTNAYYNHFLTIIALPETPAVTDIGNLIVNNATIVDNDNSLFRFIYGSLSGTRKIKNVVVNNPLIITDKEKMNSLGNNPDIKLVDGLNTMKLSGAYYQYFLHQNLATEIDNKMAVQLVTHFSDDTKMIVGHKVKFRVMVNQNLMFKPSTIISNFADGGKGLYSNKIGDVLEVTFIGDRWIVDNIIGTWIAET